MALAVNGEKKTARDIDLFSNQPGYASLFQ